MRRRLLIPLACTLLLTADASAQPFIQSIAPFMVERSGAPYRNPFSGGLLSPRIGLADADGDGRADLFTLNPDGRLRLYRNEGNFLFRHLLASAYDTLPVRSWFRLTDIDGDGDLDLFTSGELSQVILYRNVGSQQHPHFNDICDSVRGADGVVIRSDQLTLPSFVDIDGDGDLDLLIGNSGDGTITFYRNTGTATNAQFTFVTSRFEEIQVISPAEAERKGDDRGLQHSERHGASVQSYLDIDGDGDLDMLFGDFFTRKLLLFHNDGTPQAPDFSMNRLDTAFTPAGDEVETQGFNQAEGGDIDGDGDLDVIVSSLYPLATAQPLILYENVGTATAPVMRRSSINLTSEIDVGTYATVAMMGNSSGQGVFVSSTDGVISYYSVVYEGGRTVWRLGSDYPLVPAMQRAVPTIGDLNNDQIPEIVAGDFNGRLRLFRFTASGPVQTPWQLDTFQVNQNAAPAFADLDGDLDLDLVVGAGNGRLVYFRNIGGSVPRFVPQALPDSLASLDVGSDAVPTFFDIDNDGDLDAIIGGRPFGSLSEEPHRVRFYINHNGMFGRTDQYPDIVGAQNPAPMMMRRPEGLFLCIGDKAGGIIAFVDSSSTSSVRGKSDAEAPLVEIVPQVVHGDQQEVTIRWRGGIDKVFRLFDGLGREVMQFECAEAEGARRLEVTELSSGIYFYRLGRSGGRMIILK